MMYRLVDHIKMDTLRLTTILAIVCACGVLSFPSQPLNERSQEMSWQAWLLVDDQNQQNRQNDGSIPRRRITPKSVFIAPTFTPDSLPPCAEGYSSDSMGRCIKIIKLDEAANVEFLVDSLNEKFGAVDYEEEELEEIDVSTSGKPLKVNIPLGGDYDYEEEDADIAVIVSPSSNKNALEGEDLKFDKRQGVPDKTSSEEDELEKDLKRLVRTSTNKYDTTSITVSPDTETTTDFLDSSTTEGRTDSTTTEQPTTEAPTTTTAETTTITTTRTPITPVPEETTTGITTQPTTEQITERTTEFTTETTTVPTEEPPTTVLLDELEQELENLKEPEPEISTTTITTTTTTTEDSPTTTIVTTTNAPKITTYHPKSKITQLELAPSENRIRFPDELPPPAISQTFVKFPGSVVETKTIHTRDVSGFMADMPQSERFVFPTAGLEQNIVTTPKSFHRRNREKHNAMFKLPARWDLDNLQKPLVLRFSRKHAYVDTDQFKDKMLYRAVPLKDFSVFFGHKQKSPPR